ncbi:chitinase C-terminal domain-containing protein [Plesiomonas sp.]|uniref:chitinase C-terminal domain-containing protein n=1 Tax=Plesiomonas sp. TaxID=2486279 RepID=UPI003F40A659
MSNKNFLTPALNLSALSVACMMAFSAQAATVDCTGLPTWNSTSAYGGASKVQLQNKAYQANWWNQNMSPDKYSNAYQEWKLLGDCATTAPVVNTPPSVSLTAPANNASVKVGDTVTLSATASDKDGTVAKVEFYIDGVKTATSTAAPYSYAWVATAGTHTLLAKAYDDKGATTDSSVSITATATTPPVTSNQAPTITLDTPASASAGQSVNLTATAKDSDGSVAKVEFFVDNVSVGSSTSTPYQAVWKATDGSHTLVAKATDDKGAVGTSSSVTFVVGTTAGTSQDQCRPEGLYKTPGVAVPYCTVYDKDGREVMGADHPRRIIGYFTSWRTGGNGQPAYLAKDIPWDKITHINYAFAHIGPDFKVSVGNEADPANAATGLQWPGVAGADMDPSLPYKGHFNLLNKFKKQYPNVKTLISIGGWAETGGYFDDNGKRVASGGFYTMTTNPDGSTNTAAIQTFAKSAVDFIRKYGFNGVDIDYEYATSMTGAGNPDDFAVSDKLRPYLMKSYSVLMKTLREELDKAGAADKKHYMLTVAAPSSGYMLRGMETYQVTQYLDYINVMSYDLHGSWNNYVGHNAALYDTGKDGELAAWNMYGTAQYGGLGYLNTDWAAHYFRGSMPAGRINIGVPYYTRGWQNVTGGDNGLWGSAALPNQSQCPSGTGGDPKNQCGNGAVGIDNVWFDVDVKGKEMAGGGNPMWHAMNLEKGILPSYIQSYGLDPANDPQDKLTGKYVRYYDSVAVAPWLWNADKKVFISTEDEQSIKTKAGYVANQGLGGVMIWEMAGDYAWYPNRNGGEYYIGNTMTNALYDTLKNAPAYGNKLADRAMPAKAVDIAVTIDGFKVGDQNYPINPKVHFKNNTGSDIPGGTEFQFDIPTSAPANAADQSGAGLKVIQTGHTGNNIGGLKGNFHRVAFTLPNWKTLAKGETYDLDLVYYLPISGPANYTVKISGTEYAFSGEYPSLPLADLSSTGGATGGGSTGGTGGAVSDSCTSKNIDASKVKVYPNWTQNGFATGGDQMANLNKVYKANWWTNSVPGSDTSWTFVCSY